MKKTKPDKKEETVDYVEYVNKLEKLSDELQTEVDKVNNNKDTIIVFSILKLQIIHPEDGKCRVHDLGHGTYPPGHSFDIIHKIHKTLDN